jgi:hypothetical protein
MLCAPNSVLDPIVDVPYDWFKSHLSIRVVNFIFYGLMVLEILGLELYSHFGPPKKRLIPWKKAALLTFYLCVIAQAVGTLLPPSSVRLCAHRRGGGALSTHRVDLSQNVGRQIRAQPIHSSPALLHNRHPPRTPLVIFFYSFFALFQVNIIY